MLNLPSRLFLCAAPTDMRKSFDRLAALVKDDLRGDPLSGDGFLFCNRARDRVKLLYWDGDGFALWLKRLEDGVFRVPAPDSGVVAMTAEELSLLLSGMDWARIARRRRVAVGA